MKINKRKLKYASISTAFIAVVVVFVVLLNILVGALSDRFSLQLDLSAEGSFSIKDETVEFLKGIDEDINIYVLKHRNLVEASEDGVRLSENLARYNTVSNGHVKHEYVDPNVQVTFLDDYPNATKVEDALLIVASERRYVVVPEADLKMNLPNNSQTGAPSNKSIYTIESTINTALLRVLSDEVTRVGVITGHNEVDLPGVTNIFAGNGFESVSINLLTDSIPDDVSNIVIAGPQTDFAAVEIAKIDAFLAKGGNNLFFFWNPSVSRLEVLDRYLTEWGIRFENQVVLDEQYSLGIEGDLTGVFAMPTQNDAITVLPNMNQQMVVSPASHPISVLWNEQNDRRVLSLAETNVTSYAKELNNDFSLTATQAAGDPTGPFVVSTLSETLVSPTSGEEPSRVFGFASTYFAMDQIMSATFTLNNSFLNELVGYANPNTETMEIDPLVVQNSYDLNLSTGTVQILFWALVVIIPLLILLAGIVIFIRRRHR
ncbi:MAG: hypothetical protein E7471_02675 [Ruminococcaceae bacterium]|nr:hypothetical protein [Oscillospiraceae bacterium]